MRYIGTRDVPIDQLAAFPGNPRVHDERVLEESARVNSQYRSVVARQLGDGSLQLLAGHGTTAAFAATGAATVRVEVIEADDQEARRIVVVDNRANDLAGYDDALLASLLEGLEGAWPGTGFDQADLDALLAGLQEPVVNGDPDDAPDPPPVPITQPGDVWVLGEHRLVCGDATDPDVMDVLLRADRIGCVLTDPPYGMNLDTDYSKITGSPKATMRGGGKHYGSVIGDDQPFDASLLRTRFAAVREQFWFGADYYRRTLTPDDLDGSWLIWDKRKDGGADDIIGAGFETIWSAQPHQRRILRHYWCGAFGTPEARNRMHPTQKPIGLLADILTRWAPEACVVADPFAGSGSTLIAAHLSGRRARLIELDPAYCDVICARWQALSGVVPLRDGHPVDFTPEAAHADP